MEEILNLVESLSRETSGDVPVGCVLTEYREFSFRDNHDGTFLFIDLWNANRYLVDLYLISTDQVLVRNLECSKRSMPELKQLDESWAEVMARINAHLAKPTELLELANILTTLKANI